MKLKGNELILRSVEHSIGTEKKGIRLSMEKLNNFPLIKHGVAYNEICPKKINYHQRLF